jgi:hypothetical protein
MDTCWLRCEGARASETSGWRTERHMPSEVSVSANDISHAREVRDRADLSLCVISHQPSAEIGFQPHLNRIHPKLRTVSEDSGTAVVVALLNLEYRGRRSESGLQIVHHDRASGRPRKTDVEARECGRLANLSYRYSEQEVIRRSL